MLNFFFFVVTIMQHYLESNMSKVRVEKQASFKIPVWLSSS